MAFHLMQVVFLEKSLKDKESLDDNMLLDFLRRRNGKVSHQHLLQLPETEACLSHSVFKKCHTITGVVSVVKKLGKCVCTWKELWSLCRMLPKHTNASDDKKTTTSLSKSQESL